MDIQALLKALECCEKAATIKYEPVGRSQSGPFIISTVLTSDLGVYETAILDKIGANPVERYDTREQAEKGHAYWMATAATLTEITKLGHPFINPESHPYHLIA